MTLASHILVATDFSDASRPALGAAVILAKQFGAKLTLAHSFDPSPLAPLATRPVSGAAQLQIEQEMERRITEELERLRKDELSEIADVETELLIGPSPADELVKLAKKKNVDLIVIGTHGRTGLSHLLIGSVAEKVVRHAPCPVLTLRSRA